MESGIGTQKREGKTKTEGSMREIKTDRKTRRKKNKGKKGIKRETQRKRKKNS